MVRNGYDPCAYSDCELTRLGHDLARNVGHDFKEKDFGMVFAPWTHEQVYALNVRQGLPERKYTCGLCRRALVATKRGWVCSLKTCPYTQNFAHAADASFDADPPTADAKPTRTDDRPWIPTFTGKRFHPFDPRPDEIDVVDAAHGLSMRARFAGQSREFSSVAQHAVLVSRLVEREGGSVEDQFWGLHHDDPEAYSADIPSPIKHHRNFAFFEEFEARIMAAVCVAFRMGWPEPPIVKWADRHALHVEASVVGAVICEEDDSTVVTMAEIELFGKPLMPAEAELSYLRRHIELQARRK